MTVQRLANHGWSAGPRAIAAGMVAVMLAFAVMAWSGDAAAAPSCARPDAAKLLAAFDKTRAGWTIHSSAVHPAGDGLRWVALSWGGDSTGAVLLADRRGALVAGLEIGSVASVKEGPVVGGRRTLEALYQNSHGLDVRAQEVGLLQYRDGKIVMVWTHDARTLSMFPPSLAPSHSVEVYRWHYSRSGSRIHIDGTRIEGPVTDYWAWRAKGRPRPLPAETYCYSPKRETFRRCG